jgi:monothiol glutaredoxin
MKGTPQAPQCGFSRAVIQILDVQVRIIILLNGLADRQGVPLEKLKTFNCLEDAELREGIKEYRFVSPLDSTIS